MPIHPTCSFRNLTIQVVAFLFLAVPTLSPAENSACDLAVVFRSGSEAYDEAVAGVRDVVSAASCRVRYVDLSDPQAEKSTGLASLAPRLTIAIGIAAWEWLGPMANSANSVPILILREDLKVLGSRPVSAVYADVPMRSLFDSLHGALPGKLRLGVIRRPSSPPLDPAAVALAKKFGYELYVTECSGPEKLITVFTSLRGRVDAVIAEPDAILYNSATVKPLVLASIQSRIPIIGFSASFVRAGALVGVYPDFREVGRQGGELALDVLAGHHRTEEEPRKVTVAINPRVGRLLGLQPLHQEGFVVLQ